MQFDQRVLLVGVNSRVLSRIKKMLTTQFPGISIAEAPDGIAAVHRFLRVEPSLVISFYDLPLMNGAQLLREIRSFDPDTPVLLVGTDERVAQVPGSNGFLLESNLAELPVMIQCLLRRELSAA